MGKQRASITKTTAGPSQGARARVRLLDHCQVLDGARAIPAQRKAAVNAKPVIMDRLVRAC